MKFEQVYAKLKDVPYISEQNARALYDFIIKNKPSHVLELGIAHGTASCYIAAALEEIGGGRLTCVDLLEMKDYFVPSIEEQLAGLNLQKSVDIHRMKSGYNWFLHNDIKERSDNDKNVCIPKYDLAIIDGPKNWTIDSSSFFLVDKLLKDNGWIIWDDYKWTYADADQKRDTTDGISHRSLSEEELNTPQIKEIFHLLVMQHPAYGNFIIQENSDWAWANKKKQDIKTIHYTDTSSPIRRVASKLKQLVKKITN